LERFILVYGFQGVFPCTWEEHDGGRRAWGRKFFVSCCAGSSMRKGLEIRYKLLRHIPSYHLLPRRPYFLKFPEPHTVVLPPGHQAFNMGACGGHFIFKPLAFTLMTMQKI
jgi:hypothetical protein